MESTFVASPDNVVSLPANPAAASDAPPSGWVLYLLECRGHRLYAGITNDLERRLRAHRQGKGARFTRSYPPLRVVGTKSYPDHAAASRAEWAIKQLPRCEKVAFLST